MMRIITGKAKGIRLKTLEGDATRPTAERVKEAVFSMLTGDIEGRDVLDLFAGSGQMGLEAVSRGAASVTLVDKSAEAVKIIKENAEKTKLSSECTVIKDEYMSFIKRYRGEKFDIVFLDPPYASGFYKSAITAMLEYGLIKSTSIIVCESEKDDIIDDDILSKEFDVVKQARYGRVCITILRSVDGE